MVPRSGRFDHHKIENVDIRQTAILIIVVEFYDFYFYKYK